MARLTFSDVAAQGHDMPTFADDISQQVAIAYRIVLNRAADADGLKAHADAIKQGRQTILGIVQEMLDSPERRSLEEAVRTEAAPTAMQLRDGTRERHESFTVGLYRTIMRREADEVGMRDHVDRLERGAVEPAGLVAEFLDSDEFGFKFATRPSVARRIAETLLTGLTGRDPGPEAIAAHAKALQNGHPLSELISDLTRSTEFIRSPNQAAAPAGAWGEPAAFVARLYRAILRREPSDDELAGHVGRLASGAISAADLVDDFVASDEFALKFSANPGVAHKVAEVLLSRLTVRAPSPDDINAYAEALRNGYSIADFVSELTRSPEFVRPPDQAPASVQLSAEPAAYVADLYRTILCREPSEDELAGHLGRLASGAVSATELVRDFMTSEEFAFKFSAHPNVARKIVESLLINLTGRDPGPDAIDAYTNAMVSGYAFTDFIDELKRSPEFGTVTGATAPASAAGTPVELAVLAQELIAARLVSEGSRIGLPPMVQLGQPPVSVSQLASLIRTVAMLGMDRGAAEAVRPAL